MSCEAFDNYPPEALAAHLDRFVSGISGTPTRPARYENPDGLVSAVKLGVGFGEQLAQPLDVKLNGTLGWYRLLVEHVCAEPHAVLSTSPRHSFAEAPPIGSVQVGAEQANVWDEPVRLTHAGLQGRRVN